jgi:queuosine precursor transporter
VVSLPAADSAFMKEYQGHLEGVFGNAWRIAGGSMIAFWCGSFANSYVMAKMKIWSKGRFLWMRTIGSTLVGEFVDSGLFYLIAFYGIWETQDVIKVAMAQYVLKTTWEVVMTPVTYRIVGFLKKAENEDYYDVDTNFTPFSVKV